MMLDKKIIDSFVKISSIGANSDFEAHTEDGKLVSYVENSDRCVIFKTSIANFDEEMDLYINGLIFTEKYLNNYSNGEIDLHATEDVVILDDNELTLTIPQISAEVAKRTTKIISQEQIDSVPPIAIEIEIPVDILKKAHKVSKNLDIGFFEFSLSKKEILTIRLDKKAELIPDIEIEVLDDGEVEDIVFYIRTIVVEEILLFADSLIKLGIPRPNNKKMMVDTPMTFEYMISDILEVDGFIMPYTPKDGKKKAEEEEEEEKPKKKNKCKPKQKETAKKEKKKKETPKKKSKKVVEEEYEDEEEEDFDEDFDDDVEDDEY